MSGIVAPGTVAIVQSAAPVTCSFCSTSCEDQFDHAAHSEQCLTDIDDLLLVTFRPDASMRSKCYYRRNIYPNHTSIFDAVRSIKKELREKEYNCSECDYSCKTITVFNDHIRAGL